MELENLLVYIANDHAGNTLKPEVISCLQDLQIKSVDLGCNGDLRVDYPDFAKILCENVLKNANTMGILICGSGIGMSIAANRFKGIRAALCYDPYNASLARKHNDANVLCLGARSSGPGMVGAILKSFFSEAFEGDRHSRRIYKIDN